MSENLTASQRAAQFAAATRQNFQPLPTQTATQENTSLTFTLPKARLLSKIILDVQFKFQAKNSNILTFPYTDEFAPYKILRKVSLDLNNGFSPFTIGGAELAMFNMVHRPNGDIVRQVNSFVNKHDETPIDNSYALNKNHLGYWNNKGAGATDYAANEIGFGLELPITLNDRDAIGLILLQNSETYCTLNIDIGSIAGMFEGASASIADYDLTFSEIKITPILETFSIPASGVYPDLSVLKLVNSRQESFVGGGQHIIKLSTGTIYRRIIFSIKDANGRPLEDAEITSNFSLIFNQADSFYEISPRALRILNTQQYGFTLPQGMYCFDFAFQGIAGLSGSRDFVDTERLTEFWLRFNTSNSGRVSIVSETLARLT